MAFKYRVQEVKKCHEYKVWYGSKLLRIFTGPASYYDAHEFVQNCLEDDRWYAANRD